MINIIQVHGEMLLMAILQNGYEVILLLRGIISLKSPVRILQNWVMIYTGSHIKEFQFLKRSVMELRLCGFVVLDGIRSTSPYKPFLTPCVNRISN